MKYAAPIVVSLALSLLAPAPSIALWCYPLRTATVFNAAGDGSSAADAQSATYEDAGADAESDTDADASADSYPRVTAIENALLGQAYPADGLETRLARLETMAFGKTSAQVDLGDRTDALQQYVEKKFNHKLFKEDPTFVTTSEGAAGGDQVSDYNSNASEGERTQGGTPNRARAVGTALGTTLLNMAGFGMPGFGGVRVRNRADLPAEQQAAMQANQQQTQQEDPAVLEKEPPPDSAKLLTKVGWCEMQVWGHTFPSMHLTQRLVQLNGEVNFAPGKTGISLMDCSAAMIKAAKERSVNSSKNVSTSQPSAPQ